MRAEAFRAEIAPSHRQFEASLAGKRFPRSTWLLAWYDSNRRTLPWRAGPGETADPYRVWLSEIMLQQTTVKTVVPYFHAFTRRWKDVRALAAAPLADVLRAWAGLGYYARARNLHACAREVVERHGGAIPQNETELARLPGIGPYTAAAIAAIAFGARTVPVDGNVERVLARVFVWPPNWVTTPTGCSRSRTNFRGPRTDCADWRSAWPLSLGRGISRKP